MPCLPVDYVVDWFVEAVLICTIAYVVFAAERKIRDIVIKIIFLK